MSAKHDQAAKTDAWMPLWIGSYLADTMHLTRDEHGGYLLLLMAYWRNRGPLPDDDRRLAAICRATPAEWKSLRESLSEFFDIKDGMWTHGRCERELIDASARRSKASEKASSGGETRWGSTETKGRHLRSKRLAEAREKGTHTELQWSLMKEFHEHRCVRCGADGEIVKDHIAPIYQGGSDGIDNIQPLCRRCNASKGPEAKDFRKPDWNAYLGRQQEGIQEGARRLPDACSTPSPSSSLRSEEKENPRPPGGGLPPLPDDDATKAAEPKRARPSKRCPEGFEVAPGMADWAREKCPGVDVARETDKFRNHEFATARSDWPAAWRNWLYRAHDDLAKRPANRPLTAAERGDLFMAQIRGEPAHDDRRTIDVEATVHDHGSARIPFSG